MNISNMPMADQQLHNIVVPGDGYYPDLETAFFIKRYAIPSEIANDEKTLVSILTESRTEVNNELKEAVLTNGTPLDEQQILFYRTAVYALAKSKSLKSKLSTSHRDRANAQNELASDNFEFWNSEYRNQISLLRALSPSLSVELI
ncbi:head completion/stabilization protein [Pseudoalteromonas luteoviolacea]|uniref:head completion/stabilization protein n=1 Tax=Pseudoalteromonas luteoviolacea TaxID=43657 RepID=UPI001B36D080|nr:head completion/stabilization protein [Pseudoalteromonas luteoviolacea]MBQ4836785.1 phage head protein [Pseudoalteromonas luteoviolacea]